MRSHNALTCFVLFVRFVLLTFYFFAWREELSEKRIRGLTSPGSPRLFFPCFPCFPWFKFFSRLGCGRCPRQVLRVVKNQKKTTKCTKSTKMEVEVLSTREVFLPLISSRPSCPSWCYKAKELRTQNRFRMGNDVARLASTFFRVFSVFRGSNSSPDWVAGDARARRFVVAILFQNFKRGNHESHESSRIRGGT